MKLSKGDIWLTYSQEVEDVQDDHQCEDLGAICKFQVSRHDVQYPGHPHDDGQLDDDREVIHQPVRATEIKLIKDLFADKYFLTLSVLSSWIASDYKDV